TAPGTRLFAVVRGGGPLMAIPKDAVVSNRGQGQDCEVRIAVVVPCHRVRRHILQMIEAVPRLVTGIYVVDDCCPDGSGELVRSECGDPRVTVLFNSTNLGVGGAVMAGYAR